MGSGKHYMGKFIEVLLDSGIRQEYMHLHLKNPYVLPEWSNQALHSFLTP